jgi:hypothetical protein
MHFEDILYVISFISIKRATHLCNQVVIHNSEFFFADCTKTLPGDLIVYR